jgi:hypothetical protein
LLRRRERPTDQVVFTDSLFQRVPETIESEAGAVSRHDLKLPEKLTAAVETKASSEGQVADIVQSDVSSTFKSDCPEPLKYFWSGHAPKQVSERYVKLIQDRDFRLMWAEEIGLGFELPGAKAGQLGLLLQFRKTV